MVFKNKLPHFKIITHVSHLVGLQVVASLFDNVSDVEGGHSRHGEEPVSPPADPSHSLVEVEQAGHHGGRRRLDAQQLARKMPEICFKVCHLCSSLILHTDILHFSVVQFCSFSVQRFFQNVPPLPPPPCHIKEDHSNKMAHLI